jgi:hypothetical protein
MRPFSMPKSTLNVSPYRFANFSDPTKSKSENPVAVLISGLISCVPING